MIDARDSKVVKNAPFTFRSDAWGMSVTCVVGDQRGQGN